MSRKMKVGIGIIIILVAALVFAGNYFIGRGGSYYDTDENGNEVFAHVNKKSSFGFIAKHPAFDGANHLIIPWKDPLNAVVMPRQTIESVCDMNHYDTGAIVDGLNFMIDQSEQHKQIFYHYYSEEEIKENPDLEQTGLFFIPGEEGAPFALLIPGGGFTVVCSFAEGFPVAQQLHEEGYNVFILQYRVAGDSSTDEAFEAQPEIANQDCGRALSHIFEQADTFGVSTEDYSVWGFSAGGTLTQMWGMGNEYGYERHGLPAPAALMLAYTGWYNEEYREAYVAEPATYMVYAENDNVIGQDKVKAIKVYAEYLQELGKPIKAYGYQNAYHGFGNGRGSDADGWVYEAVDFWRQHSSD